MTASPKKTVEFKIVILGDSPVGKSSLLQQFVRGQFPELHEPTIGGAFLTNIVTLSDVNVKFEVWDTGGKECYRPLASMYYRGAAAVVVVYDITSRDSFDGAKRWVLELQNKGTPDTLIALSGNKSDLASERKVEPDEARKYANENKIIFMETSAKTDSNVKELFEEIANKLQQKTRLGAEEVNANGTGEMETAPRIGTEEGCPQAGGGGGHEEFGEKEMNELVDDIKSALQAIPTEDKKLPADFLSKCSMKGYLTTLPENKRMWSMIYQDTFYTMDSPDDTEPHKFFCFDSCVINWNGTEIEIKKTGDDTQATYKFAAEDEEVAMEWYEACLIASSRCS